MELFFSLLQKTSSTGTCATREQLRPAIVTWIERTYHHRGVFYQLVSYHWPRHHASYPTRLSTGYAR